MGVWHRPYGGKCSVCMAGAVIAFELGADPNHWLEPADFDIGDRQKLRAINYVRSGSIHAACQLLGGFRTQAQSAAANRAGAMIVQRYCDTDDSRAPFPTYLKAARILRRAGL